MFVPLGLLNCKQQKPTLANSHRKWIHREDIRWLTGSTGKPEYQAWKTGRSPGSLGHSEHSQIHPTGVCWGRCLGAGCPSFLPSPPRSGLDFDFSTELPVWCLTASFCVIPPNLKSWAGASSWSKACQKWPRILISLPRKERSSDAGQQKMQLTTFSFLESPHFFRLPLVFNADVIFSITRNCTSIIFFTPASPLPCEAVIQVCEGVVVYCAFICCFLSHSSSWTFLQLPLHCSSLLIASPTFNASSSLSTHRLIFLWQHFDHIACC